MMNPLQIRRAIEENNNTSDVNFVMVPYSYSTDTTIVVSDNEIKNYYNEHKNLYRQQASRDMEYVVFEVVPSAADIQAAKDEITGLVPEFKEATNLRSFLVRNSNRSFDSYWYKQGELSTISSDVDDFVWNSKEEVSDVIASGNNFYVVKVLDTKEIPESVYVKHILLQGDNAHQKADSLLNVIKTDKNANFANLATLYSADQGSQDNGELGSIGWMTQSYMVQGMESVITADVNKPYVIDTQYGSHVVLVTEKKDVSTKKQVAILEKEAYPSNETINNYYNQANRFAVAAGSSYDSYRKACDTMGVYSHPINNMLESSNTLGSIDNSREVTRWVYDNKVGKVSPIITVDNNYFVIATLKAIHKDGIA